MSVTIEGNFYGQCFETAEHEVDKLNKKNDGRSYEIYANMSAGGYQILMYRDSDGECLGFFDDGSF